VLNFIVRMIFLVGSTLVSLEVQGIPPYQLTQVYVSEFKQTGDIRIKALKVQTKVSYFEKTAKSTNSLLTIYPKQPLHELWGFGATVTEACLGLLEHQKPQQKNKIMELLFDSKKGAGFSFLRVPIGANDFSIKDYTLNDLPVGQTDPDLKSMNFSQLDPYIQFVKKARALHSPMTVMVTPWTPPPWMKDKEIYGGGQLKKENFPVFAEYLRRSIEYISSKGVPVNYLTILNEPLIGWAKDHWGFSQAYMSSEDQREFTLNHLVPLLKQKGVGGLMVPQILLHDHNWDNAEPTLEQFQAVLKESQESVRKSGIAGVAMHCYKGDLSTQKRFYQKWPGVAALNTECTASLSSKTPAFDFQWWLENQVIDTTQIGARGTLAWNLCLDETGGPRNNGCADCRGLITINRTTKTYIPNTEYYALTQVSRFVQSGARVVHHKLSSDSPLRSLTFVNPDQSLIVVIRNPTTEVQWTKLKIGGDKLDESLMVPAQGAVTFQFQVSK
jgi:glucosylceramidase